MDDSLRAETVDSPPDLRSWLMLFLGTLLYFSFGVITAAIAVLVPPIREDLGISYSQMGLVLGSWQFIYIFSSIPIGMFIDRIGTKHSLLIGAVIMALSAIGRAYATDYLTLLVAVSLFGVGGPIISIGLPKLVSMWFRGKSRTMAAGLYTMGLGAGSALALALTNSVVINIVGGWREVYLVYGVFALVAALLWLVFGRENDAMDEEPTEVPAPDQPKPSVTSKWAMLRVRPVRLVAVIGFMGFAVSHGFNNWLPQLLEIKGFSPVEAGYLSTIPRITGMVGGVIAAHLVARSGSRSRVIALSILTISSSLLVTSAVVDILPLGFSLAMLGLAARAIMPLMMAVLMDLPQVGSRNMGSATGIYFAVGEIGGFGGPALIGALYDATASFTTGIACLAILGVLTLHPLLMLKKIAPTAVDLEMTPHNGATKHAGS